MNSGHHPGPDPCDEAGFRRWKAAALLEGATLLVLLCIAVPLKHLAGDPSLVRVMGPTHGLAFTYYLWVIGGLASSCNWNWRQMTRVVCGAIVPFGNLANVQMVRAKLGLPCR